MSGPSRTEPVGEEPAGGGPARSRSGPAIAKPGRGRQALQAAASAALRAAVSGAARVAGVAAEATDRDGPIFRGAAGVLRTGEDAEMRTDTMLELHSATKPITATACLRLAQDGSLDLDVPAGRYAPAIAELPVIDGFDADGQPLLRPPRTEITTRMLLLHTAGFGYDFFNATYLRLAREQGQPPIAASTHAALNTPLLFDPGERWEYGSSLDWVGQVIEGATGRRLSEVIGELVLDPLDMSDTTFHPTAEQRARLAGLHRRTSSGDLAPLNSGLPAEPEIEMGGQGLYSTVIDYAKFIRMWLRDGAAPNGRVLAAETVAAAARNGLTGQMVTPLPAANPRATNRVDFLPGVPKSWGLSFLINEATAPTGRAAGSLSWAGLANLYFWIDRASGLGGIWATQLFPFGDPVALTASLAWEEAIYRSR